MHVPSFGPGGFSPVRGTGAKTESLCPRTPPWGRATDALLAQVPILPLLVSLSFADTCPQGYFCANIGPCGKSVCWYSSAAARDTLVYIDCCGYGFQPLGQGYDLSLGHAYSNARGCLDSGSTGSLGTYDVFHLIGPQPSPVLTFRARFRLQGGVANEGGGFRSASASGSLREIGAMSDSFYVGVGHPFGESAGIDTTLGIQLSHTVGAEFTLFGWLSSSAFGAGSTSTIESQLSFEDLPPGYAVVSCQGFVSDPIVPARSLSWGRLKAIYR